MQNIDRCTNPDYADLVRATRDIRARNIVVEFKYVEAHSGNKYHNEADRLAKKGAKN